MSIQSVKKKEMKVSRIAHEKKTVELMIRLYCRKKEKNKTLCTDCEELLRYAHARLAVSYTHLTLPTKLEV